MKEYNRVTRKYEEPQDKAGSLKTRKTCRGGKPHDYQLTLPDHLKGHDEHTPEVVLEYYASERRIKDFIANETKLLNSLGIGRSRSFGYSSPIVRYYQCSVCRKQEYEREDK